MWARPSSAATNSNENSWEAEQERTRGLYPIIQLPSRSLWCEQGELSIQSIKRGEYSDLLQQLVNSRNYYKFPSMSAPKIGWNVKVFCLWDGSIWINPRVISGREIVVGQKASWAWEPCASSSALLYFIQRPFTCEIEAYDREGNRIRKTLSNMRARFALHEMDFLEGVLFSRRVPDMFHVIPMEGMTIMSDWPSGVPSVEARSTFLYTSFTPPYSFEPDVDVADSAFMDRRFEQRIYPGWEQDDKIRGREAVFRLRWKREQMARGETAAEDAESTSSPSSEDQTTEAPNPTMDS